MQTREIWSPSRFEEGVDRRRQRAAAAVSEDHNQPQRLPEMLDRVAQTAERIGAEPVAGHANDEELVRALAEQKLDRRRGRTRSPSHPPRRRCQAPKKKSPLSFVPTFRAGEPSPGLVEPPENAAGLADLYAAIVRSERIARLLGV